jgi:GLPGLI family protein
LKPFYAYPIHKLFQTTNLITPNIFHLKAYAKSLPFHAFGLMAQNALMGKSVGLFKTIFFMKKTAVFLFLVFVAAQVFAQTTSGKIIFDHSEKIDASRMKVVTITSGNGEGEMPPLPTTIDDERTLIFGGGFAKFEGGGGPRMMRMNMDMSNGEKKEEKSEMKIKAPFESRTFFNLNKKSKIQLLTIKDEAKGTEEAVFTETPFTTPDNIEYTEKTKEIAGFKCKKAVLKEKEGKVTIWYTTDIPYNFSPVEKYTPKEGFVLSIESDEVSYRARKYDNSPIKAEELIMPGGAKKVSDEEFKAKRKAALANFKPF